MQRLKKLMATKNKSNPTPEPTPEPTPNLDEPIPLADPVIVIGEPGNMQPPFSRVFREKFSCVVDGFEFRAGENVVSQDWIDSHANDPEWLYALRLGILIPRL